MLFEVIFERMLIASTLLCTLTAGLLFTFAVVVMPGLHQLKDKEFIRAFQVIDGVIQNNSPLFIVVWAGSMVTLLASAILGVGQLDVTARLLLLLATVAYMAGVQLPTFIVNIPLNNALQTLDVDTLSNEALEQSRKSFEPRWNKWNVIRTAIACAVSVTLIILLLIL